MTLYYKRFIALRDLTLPIWLSLQPLTFTFWPIVTRSCMKGQCLSTRAVQQSIAMKRLLSNTLRGYSFTLSAEYFGFQHLLHHTKASYCNNYYFQIFMQCKSPHAFSVQLCQRGERLSDRINMHIENTLIHTHTAHAEYLQSASNCSAFPPALLKMQFLMEQ